MCGRGVCLAGLVEGKHDCVGWRREGRGVQVKGTRLWLHRASVPCRGFQSACTAVWQVERFQTHRALFLPLAHHSRTAWDLLAPLAPRTEALHPPAAGLPAAPKRCGGMWAGAQSNLSGGPTISHCCLCLGQGQPSKVNMLNQGQVQRTQGDSTAASFPLAMGTCAHT